MSPSRGSSARIGWLQSTYLGGRVQHLYINQAINYGQIVPGPVVSTGCAPQR